MLTQTIRPAHPADRDALGAIYAHWVLRTAVTFDVEPRSTEALDAWLAAHPERGPHPLLVYDDGAVRGYASSSPLKERPAYATSVELSVYLAPDARGRGIGRALLDALLARLEGEPLHRAYACIALPNAASERLFLSAGFARVGHFREVGHKLGRYWDVVWLERALTGRGA